MELKALTSISGGWRAVSAYYALKYGYPISKTPWGIFKSADFAGPSQFAWDWEPMVKLEVSNCKGLFIDVGANIGFYTIMAAKAGNKAIAFEPNSKAYDCLLQNVRSNHLQDKVTAYNAAAWSHSGKIKIVSSRHTDTTRVAEGPGDLEAKTIDEVLTETPALIKIDAEGSEDHVLRGMPKTLALHPKIVFEVWGDYQLNECRLLLPNYQITRLDRTNYLAS